jgi:hypothetical protein
MAPRANLRRMPSILRTSTWWATAAGLALAIVGVAVLFAQAVSEVRADPSISLGDAYWIGRLPWTPIGVGLAILGASLATVAGTVTALMAGGIVRRGVAILALLVAGFWWLVVTVPLVGMGGAACEPACPPPTFDPVTMAYSLPEQTAMWLLLPALVASLLGLTSQREAGIRVGRGARTPRPDEGASGALLDLVERVGLEPVRFSMHPSGGLPVGRVDEAEDLAVLLVNPVVLVIDSVLALHADVGFVCPRDVARLDPGNVMDVHVCRHVISSTAGQA